MVMNMNMQGGQPGAGNNVGGGDQYAQLMQMLGIGGGLGSAAGGAWNMFNPGKNPATAASNQIGTIPGQVKPYYQPYMDAGAGALKNLQGENTSLLSGNKQNELGASYKESPGYQFALKQALQAGNNASAAGGSLGTPMSSENAMNTAQGYAAKDYNDYMNRQQGLYNTGYAGTEGLNNQGYNANSDYANTLANTTAKQAEYGYEGQKGQNEGRSNAMNSIFSGLGMAGGSALGGPMGGAAGSGIMQLLSHLFGGGK